MMMKKKLTVHNPRMRVEEDPDMELERVVFRNDIETVLLPSLYIN